MNFLNVEIIPWRQRLDNHQINTISYGERIDTDVNTMMDGMFELFDDFCELALSRIYKLTQVMSKGFDFDALFPEEISRFKVTWIICLSELMFFSMKDQPKLKYLKAHFREIMKLEAQERALQTFIKQALIRANPNKNIIGGEASEAVLSVLNIIKYESK